MREASKAKTTTTMIEIKTTGEAAARVEMANKARIGTIAAEEATGARTGTTRTTVAGPLGSAAPQPEEGEPHRRQ